MTDAAPQVHKPLTARLWDAPTRLVHWAMVASVAGLWWTAENGPLDLHKRFGFVLLGLLVFRLLWGVFGSSTARFASFVRGPVTVVRYAAGMFRKDQTPVLGHNPLGALSVVAMLAVLLAQVGLGLFATDTDGLESGPLAIFISYETSELARDWHETLFGWLQILIGLHLAAIAFYLIVKRDNLIGAMVHGRRKAQVQGDAAMIPAPLWRAVVAGAIAVGVAVYVAMGAPGIPK